MSPSNILDDTTSNHLNCFAVLYIYIHNICNKWTQKKWHTFSTFPFFTHTDILSKRRDFLEWWIILITESLMVVIDLANEMEWLSSSSDIDG